MASWSLKARRTTSGRSSSGSTPGGSAAKTWSASTSQPTIPSTNGCRASGNCRPGAWCTSPTCYTAEELKTSRTYNELLPRAGMQDSLNVQLPGLAGSHIGWGLNDPVDSEGWGSSRITMVQRLLPYIQQFVRVRQVLAPSGKADGSPGQPGESCP